MYGVFNLDCPPNSFFTKGEAEESNRLLQGFFFFRLISSFYLFRGRRPREREKAAIAELGTVEQVGSLISQFSRETMALSVDHCGPKGNSRQSLHKRSKVRGADRADLDAQNFLIKHKDLAILSR